MSKLTEHSIRAACRQRLSKQFASDSSTMVLEEFGVLGGQRRVDIAAINGHFHGFEIKSDLDNLERLAGQSEKYSLVFDYLSVVCSEKYISKADEILPETWGLLLAERTKVGGVRTKSIRKPKLNRETDPAFVFHLLWKEEMVSVLRSMEASPEISNGSKSRMAEYAAQKMTKAEVSRVVRACLKSREGWRCHQLSA